MHKEILEDTYKYTYKKNRKTQTQNVKMTQNVVLKIRKREWKIKKKIIEETRIRETFVHSKIDTDLK